MKLNIIRNTPVWFTISGILILISIASYMMFGFNLSSDFTEGNLYEIRFEQEVTSQEIAGALGRYQEGALGSVDAKGTSLGSIVIKTRRLSEEDSGQVIDHLRSEFGAMEIIQSRSVSPVFAQTFRDWAFMAILAATVMIILYIAFAFRKVSHGISSWKLGLTAIVALLHDTIIMVGIFVLLGRWLGVEIDALFITALLTIMGFSVHDTIVVFDRIRENIIHREKQQSFADITEKSLHQTMARSINTSISTLVVLLPILLLGAPSIFWFILALFVGILIGTYSSIFIASPLLMVWQKR